MTISAKTPARVVVLLTVVGLALVLLLAGTVAALGGDDTDSSPAETGHSTPPVTHQVRTGDTLWDIAIAHTDPGDAARNVLHDIKAANGLDTSIIYPGQVLVIPVGD